MYLNITDKCIVFRIRTQLLKVHIKVKKKTNTLKFPNILEY